MAFDRVVCPTCLTEDFVPLSQPDDPFRAVRCRTCGLGIETVINVPTAAYEADAYAKHRDGGDATSNPHERWHHDVAVAHARVEQLRPHVAPGGTWIDYGCSAGAMLTAVGRCGWTPIGVELTQMTSRIAEFSSGRAVIDDKDWIRGWFPGDPVVEVGVVSMFDVIEHVLDPTVLINRISRILKDRGSLVIEVPDLHQAASFSTWKHRRITKELTEHVWHFSEKSLKAMVGRYAPKLVPIHTNTPVPGKLQMVWRNGG